VPNADRNKSTNDHRDGRRVGGPARKVCAKSSLFPYIPKPLLKGIVRKGRKGKREGEKVPERQDTVAVPKKSFALFAFFASFADKKQSAEFPSSLMREQAHHFVRPPTSRIGSPESA